MRVARTKPGHGYTGLMVQFGLIITDCISSHKVLLERTISSTLMQPGVTHSLQLMLFHVLAPL